ncbi:trihelix transcription factor ASR3-like [Impatiens glandulifera]|uniref:trihelix transcription factor ASR3-like n=1 Tax=Impatiens glandulifera TaxID=253017 RepID=UPI001FB0BAD2|nr:trihelix transcription factor ASR3-like [Impatiens glandulifera]
MPSPKKDDHGDLAEEISKTRKPRWSIRESLIVIEGTYMAESLILTNMSTFKSKWESVSSFCNEQGVNRGPDHCRKRWGSLLVDFKKIKKWELFVTECNNDANESFWTLTNSERKDKLLPSHFDKEIYDLLERNLCVKPINQVMMMPSNDHDHDHDHDHVHVHQMGEDAGMGKKNEGKRKKEDDEEEDEEACKQRKRNKESMEEMKHDMISAINKMGDAFGRIVDKLEGRSYL